MKIVFLFLALVLVTVNGEQLLRDDEADETDDALSPFEAFEDIDEIEDIEDIEDRAAKKQKKTKKTKKTKKASTTGDDGDIQGIDERGDALSPFEAFEDIEDIEDRAAKKAKKAKKAKTTGNSTDIEDIEEIEDRGDFKKAYTTGKLVKLGKYYPKGIPVKVLFSFDTGFIKKFGAASMKTLIGLVKKNWLHKSLKTLIGTTVQITGTARKLGSALKDVGGRKGKGSFPDTLSTDARKQNSKYDVYLYLMGVATNGGGGISYGATACNRNSGNDQRISMAMGPMAKDMTADKITDTNANRLKKLASSAAHELGHALGMDHDFNTSIFTQYMKKYRKSKFVYRKYGGKSCAGGFMSYAKQGTKGWSACSARDFSRYLTSGGSKSPCLNYGSKSSSTTKGGCTASCVTSFKRCINFQKGAGCSRAYTTCRTDLNNGEMANGGCKKKCKSTKTMLALKSKC